MSISDRTPLRIGPEGPVRRGEPARVATTGRPVVIAPYLIWFLVLASLISWRRDVFFSGSLDPVVVAKAIVGGVAFLLALFVPARTSVRAPIGAAGIVIVFFYAATSLAGGYAADSTISAAVIAVRLLLLSATIVLVVRHYTARAVLRSLLATMAVIATVTSVIGFGSVLGGSRLTGSLPPLNPNDLALLCAVPAIGLAYEMLVEWRHWTFRLPMLAILVLFVWFTGSRTGLLALVIGILLVLFHSGRARIRTIICLIAAIPIVFAMLAFTDTLTKIVHRDGATQADLLTLTARTSAWQSVLNIHVESWQRWIGSGLGLRQVSVTGQYWDQQVIDSSWISSLAQVGIVGVILLAALTVLTVMWSLRARRLRAFTTPLLVFLLIRSFLESGLLDVNVTFVVFFTVALLVEMDARIGASPQARAFSEPMPPQIDPPR